MLKLSEQQLGQISEFEQEQYVEGVHQYLVGEDPALATDEGLRPRLNDAHRHAIRLGFTEGNAITQFLCYEAFAPGFRQDPAVQAWLTKPGAPVEHRFADLVQVMRARTREE